MSIAKGFESGFNLALKAKSFKAEEEERKRKAAVDEQRLEMEQKTFDLKEQELESVRLRNEAMMRSYDASAQLNEARAAKQISETEFAELKQGNSLKAKGWIQVNAIVDRLKNLPSDQGAREDELYFISGAAKKLKDETGLDIFEAISPKTSQAYVNLDPILQSGDFSQLGPEYKDDLTQIYQHNLNQFKGRDFTAKDGRTGKIKKIELTGGFSAADQGQSSLIEALYTVEIDGNDESFTGFLPDAKKGIITEDIEGTDAKAVSVADAVDFMSALRSINFNLTSNPEAYELIKDEIKYNIDYFMEPEEKAKRDNVTIREIYMSATDRFFDFRDNATFEIIDFGVPASQQPAAVNEAIGRFLNDYPELETEKDDNNLFVIPEKYDGNIGKYFDSVKPSYSDIVKMVESGGFDLSNLDLKPNQKSLYFFGREVIPYNETRENYLPIIKSIYPENIVDDLVQRAEDFNATDEELLDYLNVNLLQN